MDRRACVWLEMGGELLAFQRKWLTGQTQERRAASGAGGRLDSPVHSRSSLKGARISLPSPKERGEAGNRAEQICLHTVWNEGAMGENGEVQAH